MYNPLFYTAFEYNNKLFFFDDILGTPRIYDLDKNEISLNDALVPFAISAHDPFERIFKVQDNIIAVDVPAKHVYKANFSNGKYEAANIPGEKKTWGNFSGVHLNESELLLFMRNSRQVHVFDICNLSCTTKTIDFEAFTSRLIGDKVWLIPWKGDAFASVDIRNFDVITYKPGISLESACCVRGSNNTIYIYDRCGKLFVIDENNPYDLKTIDVPPNKGIIELTEKSIVLLPATDCDDIYIINRNSYDIRVFDEYPENFAYLGPKEWTVFAPGIEWKNKIVFPLRSANYMLFIDKLNDEFIWKKPLIRDNNLVEFELKKYGMAKEGRHTLGDYISFLNETNN